MATLVGAVGAGAYAYSTPKSYTATATVLITSTPSVNQSQGAPITLQQLETYAQLFQTVPLRSAAKKALGRPLAAVTASASVTDDLISVTATSPSASLASRTANAYAIAFIANRKQAALQNGAVASTQIATQVASLSTQIATLQKQLPIPPATSTQAAAIQSEISALLTQVASLSGEKANVVIASQLASGGVTLASPATPPGVPSSPKPKRDLLLGALAGLILGLGMALGSDAIDDRIRSREDLGRAYPRLPILGLIPSIEGWKVARRPYLVSLAAPASSAAEAFRSVRTALQFVRIDRQVKVVLVTSSNPGEGKTATVANLGVGMAKAGRAVCIVSGDLRRPRLGSFVELGEEPGLTSVAIGDITLEDALRQVDGVPGLWYLGTGPTPVEASEFLGSRRTAEVFSELRDRFDVVLIDSPPLLAVADSLVLTSYVDGVVLVIRQASTRRRNVARVRELLQQTETEVIGAILSEVTPGGGGQYGDGSYQAYYGPTPAGQRSGAKSRRHAARGIRWRDESAEPAGNGRVVAASGGDQADAVAQQ